MAAVFESRLAQYREGLGMSREELAQMLGVTRQTIANIESGRHEPGVLLGMALATVLGVSIHDLFKPLAQMGGTQVRRYRFQAARAPLLTPYLPIPVFTASALVQKLPGAAVRALLQLPLEQGYDVEVQLSRPSHEGALDDIAEALGQFGLQLIQARIVEVATATAETALVGGAGGGLLGSASKEPGAALAGALIGLAVGAVVGSQIERITAAYVAARPYPMGPWQLTPIQISGPNPNVAH